VTSGILGDHQQLGSDTPLLRLRGVAVAPAERAAPVLTGVDLDVHAGECIALVGRSGAGKTTLLKAAGGAVPALQGSIHFAGRELRGLDHKALREARSRIGFISQKHDLVDALRVDKNVMAGALGRWSSARALRFLIWPREDEMREAYSALNAVGLGNKLKSSTSALSGGEQQRVAIARALVQAPLMLLADEPVASLDPQAAAAVLKLLTRLARERGMALICALHQPDLARRYCDRIVEVRDGTVASGSDRHSAP
jgi:phosphonate transport system ATP-binding protein